MTGPDFTTDVLVDAANPEHLLRRAAHGLLGLVDHADGAGVAVPDADGTLRLVACTGTLADCLGTTLEPRSSLCGTVMATGRSARCDDRDADSRVDRDTMVLLGVRSSLYVPLHHDGRTVGVLTVGSARPCAFDDADERRCSAVAGVLAMLASTASELAKLASSYTTAGLSTSSEGAPATTGGSPTPQVEADAVATTYTQVSADTAAVARFVTALMEPALAELAELRSRIDLVMAAHRFTVVVQPVLSLASGAVVGVEALARFPGPPVQPPDAWFADAERVGRGVDLELAAAEAALALLDDLPPGLDLAVNVGPTALADARLPQLLAGRPTERIVLELTEHVAVDDYAGLRATVDRLRRLGLRLSVDDAGAGYASFGHILRLAPDLIKLDRSLVAGIDHDPVRTSLTTALVRFAHESGAEVVAEGIETDAELATLRTLGVDLGQGFLLGRPAPLDRATLDRATVDQATVDQATVDQATLDRATVDRATVDQATLDLWAPVTATGPCRPARP
jgi:EAL domain-containing protein (putative c-di-GMP-specific phosphodiesterase class I)/putative methionine-R-sulfoxide reductase with GAF domain